MRVQKAGTVFVPPEHWPGHWPEELNGVFAATVFLTSAEVVQLRGVLDTAARRKLANPTFARDLSEALKAVGS